MEYRKDDIVALEIEDMGIDGEGIEGCSEWRQGRGQGHEGEKRLCIRQTDEHYRALP